MKHYTDYMTARQAHLVSDIALSFSDCVIKLPTSDFSLITKSILLGKMFEGWMQDYKRDYKVSANAEKAMMCYYLDLCEKHLANCPR